MKCERCGINEANLLIKQNINGKGSETHLCESCGKALGFSVQGIVGSGILPATVWSGNIFSALNHMSKAANVNTGVFVPGKSASLVCKGCGMTLTEFKEKGKLGCTQCYDAFGQQLDQVFRRIQSGETHRGRRIAEDPESIEVRTAQDEITELKTKISKAVEDEDYGKAAKYKTEIEKLNNRIIEIRSAESLTAKQEQSSEGGEPE